MRKSGTAGPRVMVLPLLSIVIAEVMAGKSLYPMNFQCRTAAPPR